MQFTDQKDYGKLSELVSALTDPSLPLVSNLSNVSAVLGGMENINWAGFYIAEGGVLYLGPFQGKPACMRIPFGSGVCGTAAENRRTVIVDDVDSFPGHIRCSAESRSEIVVPILKDGKTVAVIDIDSPEYARFGREDAEELEKIAGDLAGLFLQSHT